MRFPLALLLPLAAATACNTAGPPLAGHEGLTLRVKNYYADHATEENGQCPTPELQSITRTEVLEESESEVKLRLRYYYMDRSSAGFEPDILGFVQPMQCQGFATRDFTIELGADGASEVVEMSGERRNIRKNFNVGG